MAGQGAILVALAALFWGLSGGIGGLLIADGWSAQVVSFYRGAIGLLFILAWLLLKSRENGFENRWLWIWSAMAGLGVAGNFSFYFFSISQGSVAVAAMLMYCAPVFVYLVSFALKLEKPTALKWVAIVVVMLGILLLTRIYEVGAASVTLIGVATGLLAGLSYAVFIFGFKYASPHGSPQAILAVAFSVVTILLLWQSGSDQAISVLSTPSWPLFVVLGVLGAGVSFILYIVGLKRTAPAVASIVAMVEPVVAALFGIVVLNESLAALQIIGMVLILVVVTVMSVYSTVR